MKKKLLYIASFLILSLGSFSFFYFDKIVAFTGNKEKTKANRLVEYQSEKHHKPTYIQAFIGTFLGNSKNNFYGNTPGTKLNSIWKTFLGAGQTRVNKEKGANLWAGAGWTGQPLLIREGKNLFLTIGCYDHNLKKINALTGEIIWEYKFDDIIKGTGTYWENSSAKNPEERYVILQGSRLGLHNSFSSEEINSFRAVSYTSGKELWRINVKKTQSYSRDVDGSALVINDTIYIGLENGYLAVINPKKITNYQGNNYPEIISEHKLFDNTDIQKHGGNLVTEASPVRINNHIYIASGSGHVYGYNLISKEIDWDYKIGSDLNGSPAVTSDNCLLVPIEKQYISGKGGVIKLNPLNEGIKAVEWFFPTDNNSFADWQGGVIGSVATNDSYHPKHYLAVFSGIDGYLYVINYKQIDINKTVLGPNLEENLPCPDLVFKYKIGESISTPVVYENKLIAASYKGVYLFSYNDSLEFELISFVPGGFESTPISFDSIVYLASRDGYLYCFGDSENEIQTNISEAEVFEIEEDFVETISIELDSLEKKNEIEKKDTLLAINVLFSENRDYFLNRTALLAMSTKANKVLSDILETRKEATVSKNETTTTTTTTTTTISSGYKYHIIAGSFSIKENAVKFSAKLKSQGFDSEMFGPRKNFWYVPYYSFATKQEALAKLKEVHSTTNKEAWILEY
ncbi:MAG: PQQ-binding-like beta-propeller repeat protein [Bacteroidales bacterium]|nr:PQQ-binding-like beta-propeller repeat protein [Bacteroidales bacterium]